jgi:PTS system nitrogen regulatory IIA component
LTERELIFPDLVGTDRPAVLRFMSDRVAGSGAAIDPDLMYRRLVEREELGSTAIGSGVAIPHCKMDDLDRVLVAVGLSHEGVEYESEDGKPVRLFFLVVSPSDKPAAHLRSLAAISKWVKADRHVERLLELDQPDDIWKLLQEGIESA